MSLVSLFIFHMAFLNLYNHDGFELDLFAILINGFFVAAYLSYTFEFAVDLAPTVSEPMSSGLLMFCINTTCLIQIYIFSNEYGGKTKNEEKVIVQDFMNI
jgi:hypothetical protein